MTRCIINLYIVCNISIKFGLSLSDVDQTCVNTHSALLDNSFLIGTWYNVYEFALRLNLPSSAYCRETVIKNATESDIQKYRDGYPFENPFSFSDKPVLSETFLYKGMLVGNFETKFFVYEPHSYFYKEDKYIAKVYKKVNEFYVLEYDCALRGFVKTLLSRKRNPSDEELKVVIALVKSEVGDLERQRYCVDD